MDGCLYLAFSAVGHGLFQKENLTSMYPSKAPGSAFVELTNFYEMEDIIAKIHAVHQMERSTPFQPLSHTQTSYWQRVNRALQSIPGQYSQAALAIFANVIYLSDDLLRETMRILCSDIMSFASAYGDIRNDIFFFAVDETGLIDSFYRAGSDYGWLGRLDSVVQRQVRLVSVLLESLETILRMREPARTRLQEIFSKKVWVLLTDNAYSGGSLASDLKRLQRVRDLFSSSYVPEIVVAAQVITDQAIQLLSTSFPGQEVTRFYGIRFDDRFRISSDKCALFHNNETLKAVRELCQWFSGEYLGPKYMGMMTRTLEIHRAKGYRDDYAFGWSDGGYTIVTSTNCPTNSVPILWHPPIGDDDNEIFPYPDPPSPYEPPFRRNHSRPDQKTAKDSEKLKRIEESADEIREALWD